MLSVIVWLPIVAAIVLAVVPLKSTAVARMATLGVSLVVLVLTLIVAFSYHAHGGIQFAENLTWIKSFGAHYALGVDGLGLAMLVLTAVLTPVVLLASWHDGESGRWSGRAFFAWMLALEGLSLGVFAATDVFLFYVLFEATLIPIYFLVAGWGGPHRAHAAVKFLIFSLLGGLIMLAAVIGLYVQSAAAGAPSYLMSDMANLHLSTGTGRWLFVGFFIAFAIKAPMFPVHTWLPDATAEATPGTSVLLVSILDKIGTFGMVRFCLGLFPEASHWATPVVVVLAVISILYGALLAIGQDNIYRLIAFTSVSHFGFIVLGIFVLNSQGQNGANLYMFNHGLSTGALFLLAGYLIKRRGTANISEMGGIQQVAPVLAGLFLVAGLASLSLPGLSPFISEYLVLVGAYVYSPVVAAFAVIAIVLAALYILWMYQRTMTGPVRPGNEIVSDLVPYEILAVAPVIALMVFLGFYPKPLTNILDPGVQQTLSHVQVIDPPPAVGPSAGSANQEASK